MGAEGGRRREGLEDTSVPVAAGRRGVVVVICPVVEEGGPVMPSAVDVFADARFVLVLVLRWVGLRCVVLCCVVLCCVVLCCVVLCCVVLCCVVLCCVVLCCVVLCCVVLCCVVL